jgi:hypothetical protein
MSADRSRRGILAASAALLATGGAVVPALASAANPDAELIAMCDRFVATEAEWRRLGDIACELEDTAPDTPEHAAAEAAFTALERDDDLLDQIAATPALTLAGMRAKARVVHAFYTPDPPDNAVVDGVMWSIVTELAGVAV